MTDQGNFLFDEALESLPASQLPPPAPRGPQPPHDGATLIGMACAVIAGLGDDLASEDVIHAMGLNPISFTAWHCSRILDALFQEGFQAYRSGSTMRFARLKPLGPCPGFEGRECGAPTRQPLCVACLAMEEEDLWNHLSM